MKKLILVATLASFLPSQAQDIKNLDSLTVAKTQKPLPILGAKSQSPDPFKAGLYSAIVPGLGQYYNQKYWKIPVAIGLIGTGVGFIIYFDKQYDRYRSAYLSSLIGVRHEFSDIRNATKEVLANVQNNQKRYRDYATAFTIGLYALTVMDAIVDAHLDEVKKDPDLAIKPSFIPLNQQLYPAIGLSYKF
jgi:Family of unknown function (DUF5683)